MLSGEFTLRKVDKNETAEQGREGMVRRVTPRLKCMNSVNQVVILLCNIKLILDANR